MAYSTLENLLSMVAEAELINLTNDTVPADSINLEQIASSIEYADELINSYLRNKYTLPLKYVPKIIQKISSDIALYRLYSRRPRKLPEHITENYKEATSILKNIQKEQMILDLPQEHPQMNVTEPSKMVVSNKTNSSRIFGDSFTERFRM